ncbi:V-type ATP synthase subunit D [Leifsonia sp. EB34]|uniref:V-type ATP synthase subunit D n=1 Tax=Leifsonia sp. EB34 TaxID=3156303 RepID=UPI003515376B
MTAANRPERSRTQDRLDIARTGVTLLQRKERLLVHELEQARRRAEQSRMNWEETAATAAQWLTRAQALDGRQAIRDAATLTPAVAQVDWTSSIGVRSPGGGTIDLPAPQHCSSAALAGAAGAAPPAVRAAVEYAAALRAVAIISRELAACRTRRRAVENRWIPRMEGLLRSIDLAIEEQELEETLRLHWAARRGGRTARR